MLTIKNIEKITQLNYSNVYNWKIDNVTETNNSTMIPEYMFVVSRTSIHSAVNVTNIFLLGRILQGISGRTNVYYFKHTNTNNYRYFDFERLKDITNLLEVIEQELNR
jgi:hypothetical protein